MIPNAQEVLRSVHGTLRLIRLDADAMAYFDLSLRGLVVSFWAIPFTAIVIILLDLAGAGPSRGDAGDFVLAGALVHIAAPLVFLAAMIAVARQFALGANYLPFAIAYNWSHIIVVAALLPGLLIDLVVPGLAPLAAVLSLAAFALALLSAWAVARIALKAEPKLAVVILLLEIVITLGIDRAIEAAI